MAEIDEQRTRRCGRQRLLRSDALDVERDFGDARAVVENAPVADDDQVRGGAGLPAGH